MQVTRALEYANRAMVLLAARHDADDPIVVKDIATSIAAPPNFLHQVLNNLSRAGLVVCHRGTRRGYQLAKAPKEISLLDIFEVIEGPLGLTSCTVENNWCPRQSSCSLSRVWHDVQGDIQKRLGKATLDKLSIDHEAKTGCAVPVE